jgi:hypothetical protein
LILNGWIMLDKRKELGSKSIKISLNNKSWNMHSY